MRRLDVHLRDQRIGTLTRLAGQREVFEFDADYLRLAPSQRPVLGQLFEERLPDRLPTDGAMQWFAHLLPQGAMRKWLSDLSRVDADDTFELLRVLGDDLPGAVRMSAVDRPVPQTPAGAPSRSAARRPVAGGLKFSLAGQQYKLSARQLDKGLVVSGTDQGTPCIVKFDAPGFTNLARNEAATMRWAERAGLPTPPFRLGHIDELDQIPAGLPVGNGDIYVVERFDRRPGGRVHMEDFAQVFNRDVLGMGIYDGSYEQIAETIGYLCPASLGNFLEQIVFTICSGNADAHLKNFSLQYGDHSEPRSIRLSPMYDQIATVVYPTIDPELALSLDRSRSWQITERSFDSLVAIGHGFADLAMDTVEASLAKILKAFDPEDLGYTPSQAAVLRAHLDRLPLLRGRL